MSRMFPSLACSSLSQIVFTQDRRNLADVLRLVERPEHLLEHLSEALVCLAGMDGLAMSALIEAADAERGWSSIFASWMLKWCEDRAPGSTDDPSVLFRAEERLLNALKSQNVEDRIVPCMLIGHLCLTAPMVEALKRLLAGADRRVSIAAAGALVTGKQRSKRAERVLLLALESNDPPMIAASAPALAGLPEHRDHALVLLGRAIENAQPPHRSTLLHALSMVGPGTPALLETMTVLLRDTTLPASERAHVAMTLGTLTRGSQAGIDPIVRQLFSMDATQIKGGILGLGKAGVYPREAAVILGQHLTSADPAVREVAAWGLAEFGEHAAPALDALLARVGKEADLDRVLAICRCLGNLGTEAIPRLAVRLRERNVLVSATVVTVFWFLNAEGVATAARVLAEEPDAHARVSLVQGLVQLGAGARPAIRELAGILAVTPDEGLAMSVLVALVVMGSAALDAAPQMLDRLVGGSDELADLAQRVLWNCGLDVVPLIHERRERERGHARERLSRVLHGFGTPQRGRFTDFEEFDNDKALRAVVFIHDLVDGRGKCTERTVSSLARKMLGKALPADFAVSVGAFRGRLRKVEEDFGNLIEHGTKSFLGPTALGRRLIPEMRAYLEWRSGVPIPVPDPSVQP